MDMMLSKQNHNFQLLHYYWRSL